MKTALRCVGRLNGAPIVAVLFLAILLASCGPSKEAAVAPLTGEKKSLSSTFKILSVNARHTLKEKGDVRRLVKLIKSTGADIVAVQQIERPSEGKSGFDAVKDLAKQTEMYDYFGKARYLEGFDSGNALFSIYPVKQTTVRALPVGRGKIRRTLAFGVIDVGLKEVGVGSTELDDQSASERVSQAEEIIAIARSLSDVPFIVCGNFSEPATGKAAAKMTEGFTVANTLAEETMNAEQQLYTVNGHRLEPIAAERMKAAGGIDGLVVTIRITQ